MRIALNLLLKQTRDPSKHERSRSCSSPENEPERQELSLPSALLHWHPRKINRAGEGNRADGFFSGNIAVGKLFLGKKG